MTTTIHTILEEFRQAAIHNRDLGDMFERLIAKYLVTDPLYKEQFSNVWLWQEFPKRGNKPDTGIDLVAEDRNTGEYCAIQCKFYDPSITLQKADIDSFFTASGKTLFTSRIIISTTDKWGVHAEEACRNQNPPVTKITVHDLEESPIDWSHFSLTSPQSIKLKDKKTLRDHQKLALDKVLDGFKEDDRGKLIMACGTGKTFTALKISEQLKGGNKIVLFLVPSISLLSQSLREWTSEAGVSLHSFAVCSDTKVGKKEENDDISVHDLAFPATTDAIKLAHQIEAFGHKRELTVVFSTYQSIEAVATAQKKGVPEFDLIICDEAHRTTGVTLDGDDESHFVRVHDQSFIKGKKRLYMTATPRIYADASKSQAKENDATLCSMDDESIYGKEFHRLGFSKAVGDGLLSDYKVMVLAVDEKYISKTFQRQIADENNEITLEDAVKITGCWNGLSKRMVRSADGSDLETDTAPMRRAVAFSRSIKDSKNITKMFGEIIEEYAYYHQDDETMLSCEVDHVDGTFNALKRNKMLNWLKADTNENICRILSNARCLSEGVDVPSLDAVLFLNPRNSVVDVVQSVGRVMRKSPGKKYGYIILPIGIPADVEPEVALKDNQKYKVVWQVLQALRAHDDRFNATVNQIDLNTSRPDQIQIIGVGGGKDEEEGTGAKGDGTKKPVQFSFNFPNLDEWKDAIYAKIVKTCGDRRYWESWAKDVAEIAERHITRIKALLDDTKHRVAFQEFLHGLQSNLNPSITEENAIEMLSQHLITKPVFDALFEGYEFTSKNPVSVSMQTMLDLLEEQALEKETQTLEKFYASVKERASGIDNAAGKQSIIKELYDKFFNTAFPKMAERLGIVYTPVEVVDFIIKSADYALRQEFGVGLSDKGVHILDPFTGTGTFIVRMLQSGLIKLEDLPYKFQNEMHANEIVLLAYYVAAINIEETYHDLTGEYHPFEGMVLTDTFQMQEGEGSLKGTNAFPENSKRAKKQNKTDIRVIVGNPPYSSGQDNANDNNKNMTYSQLDQRISATYIDSSSNKQGKSKAYDSYIRAMRWASDRIKDKGVICYVSNGAWIDNNSMDGLRKSLTNEFTSIYYFNLRGNARTSGEQRRKEKGNVFGEGTRTPVAITILVKNPEKLGDCKVHYHDIGDYLSKEEKLNIINSFASIKGVQWQKLKPNKNNDWINQRDPSFDKFISMGDKKDKFSSVVFSLYSMGVKTNRDDWVYNFSKQTLSSNMTRMIDFYNQQVDEYAKIPYDKKPDIEKFIDTDPKKIKWTEDIIKSVTKSVNYSFESDSIRESMYRPFCKQYLYYNKAFNWTHHLMPKVYPNENLSNLSIIVTGVGAGKDFSVLMLDTIPNLHLIDTGQSFSLYSYEKAEHQTGLYSDTSNGYVKNDNIPDLMLKDFRKTYGSSSITKEDIFYYVYGVLHSPEYKERFESDLKKMLPRIPMAGDFWVFSKAGRQLAEWHLNYETIEPFPLHESSSTLGLDPKTHFKVSKLTFGKNSKEVDKTTIIYNSNISLTGIPLEAYDYVVNGKPALEWVMERYQFTRDKDSGITNDPNDWSTNPRYIIDLVKRIVRVSMETMKIVNTLPALNEHK
jgi:predicted helicase